MQAFDSISELRNSKKYNTASNTTMSESSMSEGSIDMNSTETNENAGPELHALTQAKVDAEIKSFITPLTTQLWDLTRLILGITAASNLNCYIRASTSACHSAPGC